MYRYELGKFDIESLISFSSKGWYKNIKAEKIPREITWFDKTTDYLASYIKVSYFLSLDFKLFENVKFKNIKEQSETNPFGVIGGSVASFLFIFLVFYLVFSKAQSSEQKKKDS